MNEYIEIINRIQGDYHSREYGSESEFIYFMCHAAYIFGYISADDYNDFSYVAQARYRAQNVIIFVD